MGAALLGILVLAAPPARAEEPGAQHDAAWKAYKEGRLDEAEAGLRALVNDGGGENRALYLDHLAWVLAAEGKFAEAKGRARASLQLRRKAKSDVADGLNTLAGVLDAEGSTAQAAPLYKQCLRLTERRDGPDSPGVAAVLDNLAAVDHQLGEYDEAESLYKRALEIREKSAGAESLELAATLHNLGLLDFDRGKLDQAEPILKRALAIQRKHRKPDHPEVAASLEALGWLYAAEGKPEAEPMLKQALALYEADLGKDHPHTARCCSELSRVCLEGNKGDEAEAFAKRAVAALKQAGEPALLATAVDDHVAVLRKLGRGAEADVLAAYAQGVRDGAKLPRE
jgi:tetratricopeptide (TPR) repeat protein